MATKLGMMLTYLIGILAVKSNDPLIVWSESSRGKLKPLHLHY